MVSINQKSPFRENRFICFEEPKEIDKVLKAKSNIIESSSLTPQELKERRKAAMKDIEDTFSKVAENYGLQMEPGGTSGNIKAEYRLKDENDQILFTIKIDAAAKMFSLTDQMGKGDFTPYCTDLIKLIERSEHVERKIIKSTTDKYELVLSTRKNVNNTGYKYELTKNDKVMAEIIFNDKEYLLMGYKTSANPEIARGDDLAALLLSSGYYFDSISENGQKIAAN